MEETALNFKNMVEGDYLSDIKSHAMMSASHQSLSLIGSYHPVR